VGTVVGNPGLGRKIKKEERGREKWKKEKGALPQMYNPI